MPPISLFIFVKDIIIQYKTCGTTVSTTAIMFCDFRNIYNIIILIR